MTRSLLGLALLGALAACGPGGGNPTGDGTGPGPDAANGLPAVLTPGGGVAGPAVSGALNVYAVEAGGSTPIVGASVRVGAADAAAPLTATTDGNGLVAFADAGLAGAQTITVTAAGHTAVTWIGVAGANVTVPLALQPASVPTAHAAGTIAGWDSLSPSFGHYTLGVVLATYTDDISAAENNLTQALSSNVPVNACINTGSDACNWQLLTRTGQQRHFAVIVDGDAHGTASDTSDDTYTLIGYAVGASATLTANQQVTGESLAMVGGALSPLSVAFPAAPGGALTKVVAIPMLDLGADGRIVFPLPTLAPGNTSTQVIPPTGQFAGTYDLLALATPSAAAVPYSSTLQNGISLGGTSTFPAWLPVPTQLTASGHAFSFGAPAGTTVAYATFTRPDKTLVWSVAIFDGTVAFALPVLAPDPLGTGSLTYEVVAAEIPGLNAGNFAVADLTAALHRAAGASLVFTP